MKNRGIWLVAILFAFGASMTTRADLVYSLAADQSSYDVNVGDTVAVNVYLVETATGGSTSLLGDTDAGLITAEIRLAFGATDPAQVHGEGDISSNGSFDGSSLVKGVGPGIATLQQDVDFGSPPVPGFARGPDVFAAWLGTFTFTADAVGTTHVAIEGFNANATNFTATNANFEIFELTVQPGSFSIHSESGTAVPEPSTWILAATAALGLAPTLGRRPTR